MWRGWISGGGESCFFESVKMAAEKRARGSCEDEPGSLCDGDPR